MNRIGSPCAWTVLLLVALLGWAPMSGCATTGADSSDEDNEFIGQPPPPEDDPFSVRGDVRGEAVEATPQGQIREEDFKEPTPRNDLEANPDEWDEALGSAEEGESKDEEPESEPVASRTPAETKPEVETPSEPRGVRCFSCVKICPLEGDCESAKKDVICGWGAHSTRSQAARLARGECDATLDMARQMPVWSRIEGSCPAATCSE